MKLLWRMLTRLLRHVGWGALLVPVAAIGMAVLGLSLWTIAAVVLAVIVVVRRPAVAAALVPVAMVCLGLSGLVVAAAAPGLSGIWAGPNFSYTVLQVNAPVTRWLGGLPAGARLGQALAAAGQGNVTVRGAARRKPVARKIVVRKTIPRSGATGKVAAPQVAVGSLAGSAYEVMQPRPRYRRLLRSLT